jgi:hypothetical protein
VKRLLPLPLTPRDMVVLDNASAHKATGVQQALAQPHVRLHCLSPCLPNILPRQRCMSTLKTAIWAAKVRTREAFGTAIRKAAETITVENA